MINLIYMIGSLIFDTEIVIKTNTGSKKVGKFCKSCGAKV